MPVDKVELAKDLATSEYQEIVKAELTKQKFAVLTDAERTSLLENHKKEVIEKEIPVEIEKVHTQYDKDLASIFGPTYKRAANEKTYDALKRVGTEVITGLNKKITDLEKVITEKGDPTGALTKKLQETEEQARLAIETRDKEILALKGQGESATKQVKFTEIYSELKKSFVKQLPQMFTRTEQSINSELISKSILKDGVLYLGDGSGNIKKDANFKEIKIEDVLKDEYKDVIDIKRKVGGSGSGSGGGNDDNKADPTLITKDNFEMPAAIKTQTELMSHMLELGLVRGTKQFNEIYSKFSAKLPLQ
jgi:hypothetical protein